MERFSVGEDGREKYEAELPKLAVGGEGSG
jgi:hypothetical protein